MRWTELKPLADTGTWHNPLYRRTRPPDRTTLFLPSGNGAREQALRQAIGDIGVPLRIKKVSGPSVEVGETAADRAVAKVVDVVDRIFQGGYFARHSAEVALIVAADSRNLWGNEYRDKPRTPDEFGQFGIEHMRSIRGEGPIVVEAGYAVGVVFGAQLAVTAVTDTVHLHLLSPASVTQAFQEERFKEQAQYAHGYGSARHVMNGDAVVADEQGAVPPEVAWRRIYGADPEIYRNLLTWGLRDLAESVLFP